MVDGVCGFAQRGKKRDCIMAFSFWDGFTFGYFLHGAKRRFRESRNRDTRMDDLGRSEGITRHSMEEECIHVAKALLFAKLGLLRLE